MRGKLTLLLGTSLVASLLFWAQRCAAAELVGDPIVRIAELEIDPESLKPTGSLSRKKSRLRFALSRGS